MRYWTRKMAMERLGLSYSASYRVVGRTSKRGLIASADILKLLNSSRFGGQPILTEIPSDILNARQMAAEIGCVSPRQIANWAHRTLKIVPHFRLNAKCLRFQRSVVLRWLDETSKVIRRG